MKETGSPRMMTSSSATQVAAPVNPCQPVLVSNPEVLEKPVRGRFTAEYNLRILQEFDALSKSGQIGGLLRREGLYSSNLTTWRRQRDNGTIEVLSPKKRGRKAFGQGEVLRPENVVVLKGAVASEPAESTPRLSYASGPAGSGTAGPGV